LALLGFDGLLSAVAGALFLPLYVGPVPLPISALLSGVLNAALVWAALQWTESPRAAAAPLWIFMATTLVLTIGGPGGDVVFAGPGAMAAFRPLFFIVAGAAPAAALLWRRQRGGVATSGAAAKTTVTPMSGAARSNTGMRG
jgi:hypothetical protein